MSDAVPSFQGAADLMCLAIRYANLKNVLLLPHLGTATREARLGMTFQVIRDLPRLVT